MGLILDSSILIAAERLEFEIEAFFERECGNVDIFVTAVTVSELLHGWERASPGKRKRSRGEFIEDVLDEYPVLNFDLNAARKHAHIWAKLEKAGKIIGAHDLLIAAICLSEGHDLATLNEKEFKRVAGLKLKSVRKYYSG